MVQRAQVWCRLTWIVLSSFSSRRCCYDVQAWATPIPVSKLLVQYSNEITQLKTIAAGISKNDENAAVNLNEMPYNNDVFYLRYCLLSTENDATTKDDMTEKFQQSLKWRSSVQGQRICTAARTAVAQAILSTASNQGWSKNENVFALAPSASIIGQYITPRNCITTTTDQGDLVYCIRAGAIQDVELFKVVTIPEMIDFFLYVKEVHALVCDIRSIHCDQLLHTITCNDLSNVKLIGGSSDFRKALSQSSTIASTVIYPSTYTGPTLLCNLPMLLSALIQLFTPLFPDKVKERLKFVQGPLSSVTNLQDVATASSANPRNEFLQQLQDIVYS
jgi:hypothetical protein